MLAGFDILKPRVMSDAISPIRENARPFFESVQFRNRACGRIQQFRERDQCFQAPHYCIDLRRNARPDFSVDPSHIADRITDIPLYHGPSGDHATDGRRHIISDAID
jgi:hypothetical protein